MNTTAYAGKLSTINNTFLDPWSDELLAIWVPIAVYWIQCTMFEVLIRLEIPFFEKYRIHTPEDRQKRNKVSFAKVLMMVALQHVVQIVLGIALMKNLDPVGEQIKHEKAINRYTTTILYALTNGLGQPKESSFTIAKNIAVFIQNYIVPCIQFFIAM
jgi:sphinganine C4-monooxygenase